MVIAVVGLELVDEDMVVGLELLELLLLLLVTGRVVVPVDVVEGPTEVVV